MRRWLAEQRAFAVETYFRNNNSVFMTQWIFRPHFNVNPNDSAASLITVLLGMRDVGETESATKTKHPGKHLTFRNPQNTERVSQTFVRTPRRSTKQNALALRMPQLRVGLIFHPSNIK